MRSKILKAVFRRAGQNLIFLPVLLSILIVGVAWHNAESQSRELAHQRQREAVLAEASRLKSSIEEQLNSDLILFQGLAELLGDAPDMSQSEFEVVTSRIFRHAHNVRNVGAAPDMVIRYVYPYEGNEGAIGLDYRKNDAQRAAAMLVKEQGQLILAGPLALVQGGQAFVGRYPIYENFGQPNQSFWGVLAVVIDLESLYHAAGLVHPNLSIDVALAGRDGGGSDGGLFFGDPALLDMNPVDVSIELPSGLWSMAATPKGGWATDPPNLWTLRGLFLLAAIMISLPMGLAAALLRERQKYIHELSSQRSDLNVLSERFEMALETSKIGVWEYHHDRRTVLWDERINEIYDLSGRARAHAYTEWADALHPDDRARATQEFNAAILDLKPYRSDFRIVTSQGEIRNVRAIATAYKDEKGAIIVTGVNWDVTAEVALQTNLENANQILQERNFELQAAKSRVEFLALHDPLTELPNRRYLEGELESHTALFAQKQQFAAVLQLDLDGFKAANDSFGHMAGDQMLVHVANTLQSLVGPNEMVARVGGDEFVVLVRRATKAELTNGKMLSELATKILDQFRKPVKLSVGEVRVGASIGIASDASGSTQPQTLLRDADVALYEAKSAGRNQWKEFNQLLRRKLDSENALLSEIEVALNEGQLEPYYQPQYSGETLELSGVEALARWNHPTQGVLYPSRFLRAAKSMGLDAEIDKMIFERVVQDVAGWRGTLDNVPRVSVNVSGRRISDPGLIDELKNTDFDPSLICFELVESIFLDDDNRVLRQNVTSLKEMGIDIEIDDFGTGFASVVGLLKLSPKRLKIDKQLVRPVVYSKPPQQIISAMIEIGNSLNIEVIAEGVETQRHIEVLRDLGCHGLQGFAFGQPMDAKKFGEYLAASPNRMFTMTG